jgi:hypothetical protein
MKQLQIFNERGKKVHLNDLTLQCGTQSKKE